MSIMYLDEYPSNSINERQLPNKEYRYDGYFHSIRFCIDTPVRKTENDINELLEGRSIDSLIDSERYIINID